MTLRDDEVSEQRAVLLVRGETSTRCLEVWRAHEDLETVSCKALQHCNRCLDVRRAVVDARQEVRMDVDHERAAAAIRYTSASGFRSNSVPTTT